MKSQVKSRERTNVDVLIDPPPLNKFLEVLELRENAIDDWGVGWLCMGLKTNQTLRKLDLQHNPIGPNGAHELDTLRHATGRLIRLEDKIEMAVGPLDEVEPTRATSVEADWMAGVSRAAGAVMYQSTDYAEAFGGSTSSSTAVPGAGKIVGGGRLVDSGSQKSTQVPGSSRASSRPTSAKRSRSRPTSAKSERSSVTLNSMGVPIRADGSSYKVLYSLSSRSLLS